MRQDNFDQALKSRNFHYRTIKVTHVTEVLSNIDAKLASKKISPVLYDQYLKHFDTSVPDCLPHASSVIIVATAQYPIDVRLNWEGHQYSLLVPPTYNYRSDSKIETIFDQHLTENGFAYQRANLPLKLLATSSGLSQYGRNNISYIEGLGSYYRLSAYYTDYPNFQDHWGEPHALKQCKTCQICQKKCPTHAISGDQFLINANRCLTFFNELIDDIPTWIDANVHHCIMGCMICQKHCPVNKSLNDKIDFTCEFTQEETRQIINNPNEKLARETKAKLKKICMDDDLEIISRNIKIGLEN